MHPITTKLFALTLLVTALFGLAHIPRAHAQSADVVVPRIYLPILLNGADGSAPNPTASPTTSPTATPPIDPMAYRRDVIRLINIERANAGCPAAVEQTDLMNGAQAWTDYLMTLTTGIAHTDTVDGDWYLHHGYTLGMGVQENIAGAATTPADVVSLWMRDAGHRNAILYCPRDAVSHEFDYANYDIGVGYNVAWTMALGSHN